MKRNKIIALIVVVGCIVVGSVVAFSRGGLIEKGEEIQENETETMYDYGVRYKDFTAEESGQENVISKKNIEYYADSIIQAGDERSKDEIVEELGERAKRDQANYLKAVKEGFVVTDEEIEEGIEEIKEEIKGTAAETEIEAFCEGAGITMDEYRETQKDIYRKNYMINKYMKKCQEEFSGSSEEGFSGDFSKEFERISEENVEEFGVVIE